MPSSLVDRATSDLLIGPDWAMNLEICEILSHDPGQAKDVSRGLKRRIGHKNPKIQLLALTLLETIVKNCGDIVHMYVAEREIPHEMAKIVKKKPDFHVKEKILVLIDTWQEAFGGPQSRYPQYYAAYHELLRAGVVFPRRPERTAPVFTTSQTHPTSNRTKDYGQETPESSAASVFPALSLIEIQTARGIMVVLSDMLNALDPGNKEGLGQEVICDLVEQCRSFKQRLVHLVNTTSDEDLLGQGLALNDDLQHVLAKYDALAAGTAVRVEKKKSFQALVDIDDPADQSGVSCNSTSTSNQLPLEQLLLPSSPSMNNSTATPSARAGPHIDLLSGEDMSSTAEESPQSLVPVSEAHASSSNEQNALVLSDMFSQSNSVNNNGNPTDLFYSLSENPVTHALYSTGSIPKIPGASQYDPSSAYQGISLNHAHPAWNGEVVQGMNLQPPLNSANDHQSFPPPPWETQSVEISSPSAFPHPQTIQHPGLMQNNQQMGMYPSSPTQSNQQNGLMYPGGAYSLPMQDYPGYGQQQQQQAYYYDQRSPYSAYANPNEISQGMYGLSMQDNQSYMTGAAHQTQTASSSYLQQYKRQPKPEDSLFGDLVTMAKSKQSKTSAGCAGNV